MFGISGEHLLILLIVLLIFGPRRLPDLGHSIGRTLKNFKDAMAGNDVTTTPSTASTSPVNSQISAQPAQKAAESITTAAPEVSAAVAAASANVEAPAHAEKI